MSSSVSTKSDTTATSSQVMKRLQGLFAGAVAGGIAKSATAPLDRIKILCQTGKVTSPFDAFKSIIKEEGVSGFWKGNMVSVLRIIPNRGVLFMCSDFIKDMMRGFKHYPANVTPPPLNHIQYIAAGSLSGAMTVIATYPLDLIRGRLTGAGIGAQSKYHGILQTCKLTIQEEGFRALYRGMSVSLVGAFPHEGIRFGVYDSLKSMYITPDSPIIANVAAGAVSGLCAATVLYPNDTVRRRMQVQSKTGENAYKSGIDCYKTLYRNHGIKIFYKGLTANILRAAPSAAIQFGSFEFIKKQFNVQRYSPKSM